MPLKRIVLIIMCTVLAVMAVMMGVMAVKVSPIIGMLFSPDTPGTTPPTTQTDPSTDPSTTPTTTAPSTDTTPPTTTPPATDPKHEHAFSTVKEEQKATCSAAGYTIYECSCGETKLETADPLPHSFGAGQLKNPDCTQGGYTLRKCAICGFEDRQNETEPLGHDYKETETVAVDCEQDGYVEYQCLQCKDIKRENVVKATGHTWVKGTVHAPACEEAGYTEYTCSNEGCGKTKHDDELPALGHTFSAWTIVTEPVANHPGKEKRECSTCHETQEREPILYILTEKGINSSADSDGKYFIINVGAKNTAGKEVKVYTYDITDYSGKLKPESFTYDPETGLVITVAGSKDPLALAPGNGKLILDKDGKPTGAKPDPTDPSTPAGDPSNPASPTGSTEE